MPRYCQAPFFSRPWTRPDGVSRITPETLAGHLTPGSVSCALSLTGPDHACHGGRRRGANHGVDACAPGRGGGPGGGGARPAGHGRGGARTVRARAARVPPAGPDRRV